jgi:dienelactone hydrolase
MTALADFELRSTPGLFNRLDNSGRKLAFKATTPEEVATWQNVLRSEVTRLLGEMPGEQCDPQPTLIESVDTPDFTRDLMVLQTIAGDFMPFYVLTPHNAPKPYKPVVALHGHGTWGADSLVGIENSPAEGTYIRDIHSDYARQVARLGYQVFVPTLRGFGMRLEDRELQTLQASDGTNDGIWSCQELGLNALLCGQTLMGLRAWDVMRLIDYIYTRPDVERDHLPCIGLSGGGTATMYTTALDARITSAYISGAINTWRDSIMTISHCACNYVPHLPEYADMPEVAGLIAPRPLMVENGDEDTIYPDFGVKKGVATLRAIYTADGHPERLTTHTFHGQHRWDGGPIAEWLAKQY